MGGLFQELRRRNMFRVAGVYAVVGWLIMQVIAVMTPALELPGWVDGFFAVALIAGFPIALILAWAFEMTPEGVRLTANVPTGTSIAPKTGRKLDYVIIAGLALVGAMIAADRILPEKSVSVAAGGELTIAAAAESIAVLPFADMSAAGDQEYFADGIAEEILNLLAKSAELKVAGRTSSFQFKGRNEDLRGIGEALGVANILEGSLRKSGNRVRITAQLIRSSDGFHLWSETYDGDLTDIFALQERIATAIAQELRVPLGLNAGALANERTQNLEAYEHYLAGVGQYAQRGDALIDAVDNLRAAVALDPEFAAAWAVLANSLNVLPGWINEYQGAPINLYAIYSQSRYATLRAQDLNPELAQTLHAMSNMHMRDGQWERAEKAINRAYALTPNSTAVLEDYFEFHEFTGQWEKALPIAERLVEIDPLMPFNWINLGWARWDLRDHDGAAAAFKASVDSENPLEVGATELVALRLTQGDADAAMSVVTDNDWISDETSECLASIIERYRAVDPPALLCERHRAANSYSNDTAVFDQILGGQEGVLTYLTQGVREQRPGQVNVNSEAVASVRDSDQYKQLIRNTGLDRYWRNTSWPTHCRPLSDNDFECTSGVFSGD